VKLLRLVTVYFKPIPEGWRSWQARIGEVCVSTHGCAEVDERLRLLLGAEVHLTQPPALSPTQVVQIPETERRIAEQALETAANLVSIAEECHRSISSPTPCVALLPEDGEERAWLEASGGMELTRVAYGRGSVDLELDELQAALWDRLDGLALLAEALAHDHATGKLHDFVRVFERAFTVTSTNLVTPLARFLAGAPGDFSRSEVERWLVGLRHPATHADRREAFLTEADVSPAIPRMQIGAYDVLLNKDQWRSTSSARRDTWRPTCWVGSDNTTIHVVKGREAKLQFHALDDFGRYPRDLSGFIRDPPDGWWCRKPREESLLSGSLIVHAPE